MKGSGWGVVAIPALAALASALAPAARAALVESTVALEVVDVPPAIDGIAVGDRYLLAITVDDQDVDTNPSIGAGQFANLVPTVSASADPANAGDWDPAGGTYSMTASNFVTNAFGSSLTLQLRGTFPAAGAPFADFDLAFLPPGDVSDGGLGDTLAEQLGLAPGALDLAAFPTYGAIRFHDGDEDWFEVVVTAPEPVAGLGALVALGVPTALRAGSRRSAR